MCPSPVRVLIVDDDPTYRLILSKAFEELDGVELVGTAPSLAIARSKLAKGNVDIVTIDVVLKDESGLELLPWLRAHQPHVFTALVTAGKAREAQLGVDALLLGASTLILKPGGPTAKEELSAQLANIVRMVRERPGVDIARSGRTNSSTQVPMIRTPEATSIAELIAVGASTGGPPVILQFLKDLPRDFDVPIVLTQHMPALHVPYFVELLARESRRDVRLAKHGEPILRGVVHIAYDAKHMRVARLAGRLVTYQDDGPEEHNCKPAVDPMFRSVAEVCGGACVGVVMTGMGADGALGALALRKRGAPVLIQDRASSVVWGMPGAVAAAGAASETLPAHALPAAVVRWSGWGAARPVTSMREDFHER